MSSSARMQSHATSHASTGSLPPEISRSSLNKLNLLTKIGKSPKDGSRRSSLSHAKQKEEEHIKKHMKKSDFVDFQGKSIKRDSRSALDILKEKGKGQVDMKTILADLETEREIRPEGALRFKLLIYGALLIIYSTIGATSGLWVSLVVTLGSSHDP